MRERLAAAVPTAATTTRATSTRTIFQTVSQLMEVRNFEKILRVGSRYRHISSFLNDPFSDAYVLYAFGTAKNMLDQKMKLAQNTRFIISKEPTKEEHIEYRRNKRQQKYINVSSEACRVAYLSGVS